MHRWHTSRLAVYLVLHDVGLLLLKVLRGQSQNPLLRMAVRSDRLQANTSLREKVCHRGLPLLKCYGRGLLVIAI